ERVVELPPVGDVLDAVAGVVDLDVVARVRIELAEVRAAGRVLERNPVGDDRQLARRVRGGGREQVGVVGARGEHAAPRLAARPLGAGRAEHAGGGQRPGAESGDGRRTQQGGSPHGKLLGSWERPSLRGSREDGRKSSYDRVAARRSGTWTTWPGIRPRPSAR